MCVVFCKVSHTDPKMILNETWIRFLLLSKNGLLLEKWHSEMCSKHDVHVQVIHEVIGFLFGDFPWRSSVGKKVQDKGINYFAKKIKLPKNVNNTNIFSVSYEE